MLKYFRTAWRKLFNVKIYHMKYFVPIFALNQATLSYVVTLYRQPPLRYSCKFKLENSIHYTPRDESRRFRWPLCTCASHQTPVAADYQRSTATTGAAVGDAVYQPAPKHQGGAHMVPPWSVQLITTSIFSIVFYVHLKF